MTVSNKKTEWDKENMRTVSCRLRKEEAEKFREYASYLGTTTHAILAEYVRSCLAKAEAIPETEVARSAQLNNEVELLRRKLKVAEKAIETVEKRAVNAEKLVNDWLRSTDSK